MNSGIYACGLICYRHPIVFLSRSRKIQSNSMHPLLQYYIAVGSVAWLKFIIFFCSSVKQTYFGTITNNVTKYSESSTKSSFFTISARLLVSKLPLYRNKDNNSKCMFENWAGIHNSFWCLVIHTFSKNISLKQSLLADKAKVSIWTL